MPAPSLRLFEANGVRIPLEVHQKSVDNGIPISRQLTATHYSNVCC